MILTGLLGGSFNPAHDGHRRISLGALDALGLDEIWWLVSPGNPLKPAKGMAPLARPVRVGAGHVATCADPRHRDRARAWHDLHRRHARRPPPPLPETPLHLADGADNLAQFHRWRDWRRIAELVPIAVIGRPGYDASALKAPAWGWLRRFVRPAAMARNWTMWRVPALVLLELPPDPTSPPPAAPPIPTGTKPS